MQNTTLDGDRVANLALANLVNTTFGLQPVATLLIQDDETSLGFSSASYAINENAVSGNATVTLLRAGATNTLATITIATVPGGTTTPFADYIPTNAVVTFLPGETSRQFSIRISVEDKKNLFL